MIAAHLFRIIKEKEGQQMATDSNKCHDFEKPTLTPEESKPRYRWCNQHENEKTAWISLDPIQRTPRYRFYQWLMHTIPDPGPCIYILSEGESVIYVGQTQSLYERATGHRNSRELAGFRNYARYKDEHSDDWPMQVLPYEQCE